MFVPSPVMLMVRNEDFLSDDHKDDIDNDDDDYDDNDGSKDNC